MRFSGRLAAFAAAFILCGPGAARAAPPVAIPLYDVDKLCAPLNINGVNPSLQNNCVLAFQTAYNMLKPIWLKATNAQRQQCLAELAENTRPIVLKMGMVDNGVPRANVSIYSDDSGAVQLSVSPADGHYRTAWAYLNRCLIRDKIKTDKILKFQP